MGNRQSAVYDSGAVGRHGDRTLYEARIALHYALTLKFVLQQAGYSVFMTRTDDETDTPLRLRVPRAQEAKCRAFLSIHLNSSSDSQSTGIETLYRTETQRAFAQRIHNATLKAFPTLRDRGLKQRERLAVLQFEPHACLLELGFINNPSDMSVICPLSNTDYRSARVRWAESIVETLKGFQP